MTPAEFIKKWKPVALTERAAAHTHFLDLCKLFEHEDPVLADPTGEWFTFEKGATKTGGGEGFADVWKKNFFAWEYKKKKRDLNAAMEQLVRYAAALENPPLQVVCDTDRFIIRTAWTNTVPKQYEIELDDLTLPENREILWAVFHDPERLRPKETRAGLTKEAADKFSTVAQRLQSRGTSEEVAHFVNQLVFCFFANSVKLLPDGFFQKLLKRARQRPDKAPEYFNSLFEAMEIGGEFDLTDIAHFNGGLFDGRKALLLDKDEIDLLVEAAGLDWSLIDPTIFGTLFERFLDPDKRAQIGAHYTDPEKIMMIVEPVILLPLRAEWELAKSVIKPIAEKASGIIPRTQSPGDRRVADTASRKLRSEATELRDNFLDRLAKLRILDPACGSGNFLYLALQGIKDLENRVVLECEALGLPPKALAVGPEIVHGIEINQFAAELARTTIWIGDIQWRRRNGIYSEPPPILRKLDAIECRDAVLNPNGTEANWPDADFLIGNPPFLGDKKIAGKLDETYVEALRSTFSGRVGGNADLVCYWFDKAALQLQKGRLQRAGLVATNSIRRGANREVLDRIVTQGEIFEAWSDERWVLDGAAVRVSLICFGMTKGSPAQLDGRLVPNIHADLTGGGVDVTKAVKLNENKRVSFLGIQKSGPLDVPGVVARRWLKLPLNPNGKPNADVLRPFWNGDDVASRPRDFWLVDLPRGQTEDAVSLFQEPFEFLKKARYQADDTEDLRTLEQARSEARDKHARDRWWEPYWPRPEMRSKIDDLSRYIVTPETPTHTVFVWLPAGVLPDKNLIVITREDDPFFGVLHSRAHLNWVRALGSPYGNHPTARRYNNSRVFETFPFPKGLTPDIPASSYEADARAQAIGNAAKRLDELRNAWLNPADLVKIVPELVSGYPDRVLPIDDAAESILKTRTLTNLYNEPPQWLADAHGVLDAAVAAAYGWPSGISDEQMLANLIELNAERSRAPELFSPAIKKARKK